MSRYHNTRTRTPPPCSTAANSFFAPKATQGISFWAVGPLTETEWQLAHIIVANYHPIWCSLVYSLDYSMSVEGEGEGSLTTRVFCLDWVPRCFFFPVLHLLGLVTPGTECVEERGATPEPISLGITMTSNSVPRIWWQREVLAAKDETREQTWRRQRNFCILLLVRLSQDFVKDDGTQIELHPCWR